MSNPFDNVGIRQPGVKVLGKMEVPEENDNKQSGWPEKAVNRQVCYQCELTFDGDPIWVYNREFRSPVCSPACRNRFYSLLAAINSKGSRMDFTIHNDYIDPAKKVCCYLCDKRLDLHKSREAKSLVTNQKRYYFCDDSCRDAFALSPLEVLDD